MRELPQGTRRHVAQADVRQLRAMPQAWKPATFDHDRFFPLDKDHIATCLTCHVGNNYKQYTCYGCHEHTPANMQAKHRDEGVSESLDNCVRCLRSASGEGERKGSREGGGDRKRGKRD